MLMCSQLAVGVTGPETSRELDVGGGGQLRELLHRGLHVVGMGQFEDVAAGPPVIGVADTAAPGRC